MPVKAVQQFMLGTVMNKEEQAVDTMKKMKAAGYDGIELCGFMIHPSGFLVKMMTKAAGMPVGNGGKLDWPRLVGESGLKVVSIHQDLGSVEREPAKAAEEAKKFGTDKIVITGMYRFPYGESEAVKKLADRLNKAGAALKAEGARLLYHNHNCEFLKNASGKNAYQLLLAETDASAVNFEFDSYWCAECGENPLAVMDALGDRMKLWHINDRGTRQTGPCTTPILKSDSMELGYGAMPLEALSEKAKAVGVEAVILESHRNWIDKSPVKSFERSAAFLNARF
ncbi:MAG: sugar phosphate isomerase/epimerase [Blautia sp.]|nr:sugar phosphate isomerase/epimerase [Blautia sp.]MCM1199969.1 sugar phosphate isomerase/epimerase [Bacteroides fragilis]